MKFILILAALLPLCTADNEDIFQELFHNLQTLKNIPVSVKNGMNVDIPKYDSNNTCECETSFVQLLNITLNSLNCTKCEKCTKCKKCITCEENIKTIGLNLGELQLRRLPSEKNCPVHKGKDRIIYRFTEYIRKWFSMSCSKVTAR